MVNMFAPTVSGLKQDGTKVVSVYDNKTNAYKLIKVPAQEADEFISKRNEAIKKANKKNITIEILGPLLGGLGGYMLCKNDKPVWALCGVAIGYLAGLLGSGLAGTPERKSIELSEQFISKNENQ